MSGLLSLERKGLDSPSLSERGLLPERNGLPLEGSEDPAPLPV